MVNRRRFVASAAAGTFASIGLLRFPADAAEFSYKLAHDDPAAYAPSIRIAEAADAIKRESGGRLEIAVFPDSALGGSAQLMTQLRAGAVQFLRQITGNIALVVPLLGIDGLPYVYANAKQADVARSGALGASFRDAVSKVGLYGFAKFWDYGFRQVFNSTRPITEPDDLKGLKIRVPVIKDEVTFFKAMNSTPVPLNVNEMYTALQTHVIDGGELPVAPIASRKLFEVSKYLSLTSHISTGMMTLANADAWNALPKNLQDIVERNFAAATIAANADIQKNDAATVEQLKSNGMTVNAADIPAFKLAVKKAGLYAQWRDNYGAKEWALLEQATGPLA